MIAVVQRPHDVGAGPRSPGAHRTAFVQGLRALGIPTGHKPGPREPVACWGWRVGQRFAASGHPVIVMERGYVGDRFAYTSLGWNGLNGYARFPEYPDDGGARFLEHGGRILPWRESGDYVLILGQVRGDMSLRGRDLTGWYAEQAALAARRYGLPVYFRPHPLGREKGFASVPGVRELPECSLADALAGARLAIAYNSNACLDAVLAGVPCYAGDRGTMAWRLCMRRVDELAYPDREEVAHQIAWCQWSLEEIASGRALVELMKNV